MKENTGTYSDDILLPKARSQDIFRRLKENPIEDVDTIQQIESYLRQKRGYVFRMPKPGEPVILMLSGGADSVSICDILLRKYRLQVYPLHLRRGQLRMPVEERSVSYFSKYFSQQFPQQYHREQIIQTFIPPLEFRFDITKHAYTVVDEKTKQLMGIPLYTTLSAAYAVQYAAYLEREKNVRIRTISYGFVNDDGRAFKYETLTFLRLATYHICNVMNDHDWQITALPIEKNLGHYFGKPALFTWCAKHHVPISKSFSCMEPHIFHCGECYYCLQRKKAMADAGITDRTFYINSHYRLRRLMVIVDRVGFVFAYAVFFLRHSLMYLRYFVLYLNGRDS